MTGCRQRLLLKAVAIGKYDGGGAWMIRAETAEIHAYRERRTWKSDGEIVVRSRTGRRADDRVNEEICGIRIVMIYIGPRGIDSDARC